MRTRYCILPLLGLLGLSAVTPTQAQIAAAPALMNFQGRLATPSGTPIPDGTYSIRFSLWDAATAGTEKWNQTLATVTVKNGTFAVLLNTNTAGLFNGNLWLETKIGSDAPLAPRQQLVTVPYAFKASTVPDNSIAAANLLSDVGSLSKVSGGAMNASGSNIGIGVASPSALLHLNGAMKINAANTLEFGAGVAGKDINAGKIGYQAFTSDALDIVGAGSNGTNRKIKFFTEGGATFAGGITTSGGITASGTINAPNALIPLILGNVTVGGELTANVVTVLGGSDVAEPYNVAAADGIKPIAGMLVCIDEGKVGQMRVASRAYDSTVAGIISGANGINPGITLRQKGTVADGELPVASIGRVWCYCDADANGEIKAGDMLTSSDTPGHAMKASDRERRDGAVIGKAMSSLKSGKGLVLVLVSLK